MALGSNFKERVSSAAEASKAAKEKFKDLLAKYGGEAVGGDLAGFFVYEAGATLLGKVIDLGNMPTMYKPVDFAVIRGLTDSLLAYDADTDTPIETIAPVDFRLLFVDGVQRKINNSTEPVVRGDIIMLHISAKMPLQRVGSTGQPTEQAFWRTFMARFPDETKQPTWAEIKQVKPRIAMPANGRVAALSAPTPEEADATDPENLAPPPKREVAPSPSPETPEGRRPRR